MSLNPNRKNALDIAIATGTDPKMGNNSQTTLRLRHHEGKSGYTVLSGVGRIVSTHIAPRSYRTVLALININHDVDIYYAVGWIELNCSVTFSHHVLIFV